MTRFSLRREATIGVAVYGLYLLVRRVVLGAGGRERATVNAERVAALEERLGLAWESPLQHAVLRSPRLVGALNAGYAALNVTLTVGWLVILFRRRDRRYLRLRRACVIAHLAAQPVFALVPVAPPRALPGYVDTLAEANGIDLEHPLLVRLYNPVAAMPSLHVAFAVLTAAALVDRRRSCLAAGGILGYPVLVTASVTATGNHFVLDALAGAGLGAAAWRLA